jgi:hypothetical protein
MTETPYETWIPVGLDKWILEIKFRVLSFTTILHSSKQINEVSDFTENTPWIWLNVKHSREIIRWVTNSSLWTKFRWVTVLESDN